MAFDQLSKKNNLTLIKESFGDFIVRPLNSFGLGGFVFDIDGEATNKLESDITDHYVEDNSAIQDHIAIKPIEVTLKNYVGELVKTDTDSFLKTTQEVVQKLTTINSYLPVLSASADLVKDIASGNSISYDDAVNEAVDLWTLTKNLNPNVTKQQRAYLFFKALFTQKILVGLQTPWEFIPNMAIKTIVATQSEDSDQITTFAVTLKQIRTASTQLVSFDKNKYQSRTKQQAQEVTDKGKATGNQSVLSQILELF